MKRAILIILLLYIQILECKELKFEINKIDENLVVINISAKSHELNDNYPYHVVKKGEYLNKISKIHRKKTSKLVEINELEDPNLLYPKQKIYLEKKIIINLEDIPKNHIVKKGENLISISFEYGLNWKILKKLNNLELITDIYPNQKLKLK